VTGKKSPLQRLATFDTCPTPHVRPAGTGGWALGVAKLDGPMHTRGGYIWEHAITADEKWKRYRELRGDNLNKDLSPVGKALKAVIKGATKEEDLKAAPASTLRHCMCCNFGAFVRNKDLQTFVFRTHTQPSGKICAGSQRRIGSFMKTCYMCGARMRISTDNECLGPVPLETIVYIPWHHHIGARCAASGTPTTIG